MSELENIKKNQYPQPDSGSFYSQNFEMAQLFFNAGRLSKSLVYFNEAMNGFKEKKQFDQYLSCFIYIIQVLNELQETDKLNSYKEEVKKMCKKEGLTEKPLLKACKAYYAIYVEKDFSKVSKELTQGLKIAFSQYDEAIKSEDFMKQNELRFEIMICLYVYSIYYMETEDYKNCLKELNNLNSLLKDFSETKEKLEKQIKNSQYSQDKSTYKYILESLNDKQSKVETMRFGVHFIEVSIQIKHSKKYSRAINTLWTLYEEANKSNNSFFIPYILFYMSLCQHLLGNKEKALLFYDLAKKNANPERKLFLKYLKNQKMKFDTDNRPEMQNHDIIFNKNTNEVIEKVKGPLALNTQFLLIDLLKFFIVNQGVTFSKNELVQELWKEDYEAEEHDNKIYVTIKRLREAIEVDSSKPTYICRNSRGYYFSNHAKVLIKED